MAIIYFLQEFFFDGCIYLTASGSYNKVAIFPAIYFTRPSSPGALSNSMASSLSSSVAPLGYRAPLSIASVVYSELSSGFNICIRASLFMRFIIPQISNTVNFKYCQLKKAIFFYTLQNQNRNYFHYLPNDVRDLLPPMHPYLSLGKKCQRRETRH